MFHAGRPGVQHGRDDTRCSEACTTSPYAFSLREFRGWKKSRADEELFFIVFNRRDHLAPSERYVWACKVVNWGNKLCDEECAKSQIYRQPTETLLAE